MVGLAVLRSRGLTLTEVESFCSMRHLDDRDLPQDRPKRDWIRRPAIIRALVKNPKVPLRVSLPLVKRLPMRDLRNIGGTATSPEAVRAVAQESLHGAAK